MECRSLRPAGLITVLNEIAGNDQERVLECGGGISRSSSLVSSPSVAGVGCDDPSRTMRKVGRLRSQLQEEGLEQYATVVTAPLAPCAEAANDLEWSRRMRWMRRSTVWLPFSSCSWTGPRRAGKAWGWRDCPRYRFFGMPWLPMRPSRSTTSTDGGA